VHFAAEYVFSGSGLLLLNIPFDYDHFPKDTRTWGKPTFQRWQQAPLYVLACLISCLKLSKILSNQHGGQRSLLRLNEIERYCLVLSNFHFSGDVLSPEKVPTQVMDTKVLRPKPPLRQGSHRSWRHVAPNGPITMLNISRINFWRYSACWCRGNLVEFRFLVGIHPHSFVQSPFFHIFSWCRLQTQPWDHRSKNQLDVVQAGRLPMDSGEEIQE